MPDGKMKGKRVFVTGAAAGIGFGIAEQLGQSGAEIYLSDINRENLNKASEELGKLDIHHKTFVLDVTDNEAIANTVSSFADETIDILVNNAGLQHVAPLENFPSDLWTHIIAVMLTGPAMLTRALLVQMKSQNYGRIINIGSIHSLVASPYKSAYVSAKHGLVGFSKTIALETAAHNITINTICPSYVQTDLVKAQIADQAKTRNISEEDVIDTIMLEPMPKHTFIAVEEIASSIEFLSTDSARNITGQALSIDGGWTIR